MDPIAIAALVVSILSAIFTLLIGIITLQQNKKINTTNLEAKHFEEIFTKYIVKQIPEAVEEIEFVDNSLCSYKHLVSILMDMICDCKYYAYAKHEFYQTLQHKCMDLEDKLLIQAQTKETNPDKQSEFIYHIHEDLVDIIKLINKNYHNF